MHPHDRTWVEAQLAKLPVSLREHAREQHSKVYREGLEIGLHEGTARREANTRLREYIKKVQKELYR